MIEIPPSIEPPPIESFYVTSPVVEHQKEFTKVSCPDCSHHAVFHIDLVFVDDLLPHVCVIDGKQVFRQGSWAVGLR